MAETPSAAAAAAAALGGDVVIKAQVLTGGRGKAGGVRRVASAEAAERAARDILALRINGLPVARLLVVSALPIRAEYYIGLTIDRAADAIVCILSASGGVDIETVARETPAQIETVHLTVPDLGHGGALDDAVLAALRRTFGDAALVEQAGTILAAMCRLMVEKDASLVEINPLAAIDGGGLVAADAKIVFDDNGLFKHPELEAFRNDEEWSAGELEARRAGLSYVSLGGNIGCMVNGAGLAMATMDCIQLLGGRPANFLDVGGSSAPQKVLDAIRILLRHEGVRVILVNIFGGLTRCDDIAHGLLLARAELGGRVPMVVRLIGTNDREARALLNDAGIAALTDMTEAVEKAVACAAAGGPAGTGDGRRVAPTPTA